MGATKKFPGLARRPVWLNGQAHTFCEDLLGPNARLRIYLDDIYLNTFVHESDVRLTGRLVTAELLLSSIEKRWLLD